MATKASSRPATKKAATKKTTKAVATPQTKKPATKSRATKKTDYTSFQLSQDKQQFMSFSVTRQTIYWAVLGVLAVLFCWYTLSMTQQINDIYSQIEEIRVSDTVVPVTPAEGQAE